MNTKHTFFRLSAAAALLLALAACNKYDTPNADDTLPAGEYPVIIQANGLDVTAAPVSRATVDGDWQGVTSVALRLDGAVKEYTVTASDADGYRSATLSRTADPFYWTSRDDITVSAWWPYAETLPAVKVAEDQSTLAAFQGSDFISAENQTVTFSDPKLTFTHRTARVTVVLKPGTGIASVAGATVSLVSLSAEGSNPTAIKTCNTSGDTYEALTAPQTVAAGEPFIRVVLGDGTFYFRPQNDVVLEAGSRYTYTVNVNATGLTLASCEIGGWEPGGGESGAAEDLGYIYDNTTNTYTVYNANGLFVWAEAAQNDLTIGCTLTADIDLTGKEWTPIGTESQPYIGTFDGGGHTITGLTVDLPEQFYVGLIGYLGSGGTVQNLTLTDVNVAGKWYVGSVVGENSGTVTGCCHATGDVTGNHSVGGVVGENYHGTVTACTVSGNVTGTSSNVGGVVGYNNGTVIGCHATGDVSGDYYVGGVVGTNSYNTASYSSGGTVTGCYATGNVSGTTKGIGGVVGWNFGSVTGCYWRNNRNVGIGDSSSGDVTKVDGTTVTWVDAQRGMNEAIDAWNTNNPDTPCDWQYTGATATTPPVLTEQQP